MLAQVCIYGEAMLRRAASRAVLRNAAKRLKLLMHSRDPEFIQHTASGVFEHFRLSNFQTLSPGLIPATPPAATTTTRRTTFSVDATTRQIASPHVRSPIRTVTTTRRTTTTTTTTFPWMRLRGQWLVRPQPASSLKSLVFN